MKALSYRSTQDAAPTPSLLPVDQTQAPVGMPNSMLAAMIEGHLSPHVAQFEIPGVGARERPGGGPTDVNTAQARAEQDDEGRGGLLRSILHGATPVGRGAGDQPGGLQSEPAALEPEGADESVGGEVAHDASLPGQPAGTHASPDPAALAATIHGNPRDLVDSSGNAITEHREPTVADSSAGPAEEAELEERAAQVKPVATQAAPLRMEPPGSPAPDQVFVETMASPLPAGFTSVTRFNGTLAQPIVEQDAPAGLFIDGGPTPDDVQQGYIGDCYFIADLMSIVGRDPGKIMSMMADDGANGAVVTLWSQSTAADGTVTYAQQQVHASSELSVFKDGDTIHGAQLRAGEGPKAVEYWSKVEADALEVHRKDTFQLARWAPLLEKAFARFSEQVGQYGGTGHNEEGGAGTTTSGYKNIDGGWSHHTMFVFYGPDALPGGAANVQQQGITWAPGADLLATNPDVVDQLLLLAGRGDRATDADNEAPILTATSMVDQLIPRLKDAIVAAEADADWANLGEVRQTLVQDVQSAIQLWEARQDPEAKAHIGNTCQIAARSGPSPEQIPAVHAANPGMILFPVGSSTPTDADKLRLSAFAQAVAATTDATVSVDVFGHASSDGGEDANRALAERRADAVVLEILAAGGDEIGWHDIRPMVAGELGAVATAEWRRADIRIGDNVLHENHRSPAIRAMMDLILDLRNIGTDRSSGQRNIYGDHVYSVVAAAFLSTDGAIVPLAQTASGAARAALFPQVDMTNSTVRLRNPHRGNEPDRQGDNQATRAADGDPSYSSADGIFDMSMAEFFRNFTSVESGVFPRTP
jgi:outer membrane protein OmpA-like peptidoglycan-associated protein